MNVEGNLIETMDYSPRLKSGKHDFGKQVYRWKGQLKSKFQLRSIFLSEVMSAERNLSFAIARIAVCGIANTSKACSS